MKKKNTKEQLKRKNDVEHIEDGKDNQMKKRVENVITVLVLLVVLAVAFVGLWKLSGEGDKPSKVLAFTMGDEEVYMDEVNLCILQNILNLGITAESMQNTTAEDGTDAATHYKQEILEMIMDYKVEYLVAKEQGLALTEDEEKEIQVDVVNYLGTIDARLLNQWGITQELIEEVYTQRYLAHKLEDKITSEVEVEEQRYCTIYLLLFPKVEMAEDGNYVAESDGVTPIMLSDEEIERRKEEANEAWKELKDGADVEEIAKKYGVANYSAEESNVADSFGEPFAEYAKSLKAGEYSPVLETPSCYAILKMVKENNEEIAEQIMQYYKEDVMEEALEEERAKWYGQIGIGQEPEFVGNTWKNISLYDYVQ